MRTVSLVAVEYSSTDILTGSHKKDHSKRIIRLASSLPSWQACLGLWSDGKIASKKHGGFLACLGAAISGSN